MTGATLHRDQADPNPSTSSYPEPKCDPDAYPDPDGT
jgi:hypothetical protein